MTKFQQGYKEGKSKAQYFDSASEIKKQYARKDSDFIKGLVKGFNDYWTERLMEEY